MSARKNMAGTSIRNIIDSRKEGTTTVIYKLFRKGEKDSGPEKAGLYCTIFTEGALNSFSARIDAYEGDSA